MLNLTSKEKAELRDYLHHIEVIPRSDRRAEHDRRKIKDRQLDMALESLQAALRAR